MAANQPSGHNRFINSLLGWIATHAAMGFSRAFFRYCCGGKVHGETHIRHALKQGFILAANHGSYLDWMVLGTYFHHVQGVRLIFLAKDRLFRQRPWKWIVEFEKCIRVSDDGQQILDQRDLRQLKYIAIFPEGTRSRDGSIGHGHPGAVKLSLKLGKPIIPVGLRGFYDAWPPDRKFPRPRRCSIVFGEPIDFALPQGTVLSKQQLDVATDCLMGAIRALCKP
jgi:1-acyl-sn-glycerol-3-phosphate acyltransferase